MGYIFVLIIKVQLYREKNNMELPIISKYLFDMMFTSYPRSSMASLTLCNVMLLFSINTPLVLSLLLFPTLQACLLGSRELVTNCIVPPQLATCKLVHSGSIEVHDAHSLEDIG